MSYLSDDLLEGRGTGTRGYQLAALYIKSQFEQMGLKAAGDHGTYFQNVRLRNIELDRQQSSLTLQANGKTQNLIIDKDFAMRGDPLKTDTTAEAQIVFAGFGVTAPELNYDDYAGADVRGKIVAVLFGAPPSFSSTLGAHYSSGTVKLANAAAHGAIGMLSIWAGRMEKRVPFTQVVHFFRPAAMRWLDAKDTPNDAQPTIRGTATLGIEAAKSLFEMAGKSWDEVLAAAEQSKPQSMPLNVTGSLHLVSKHTQVESPNIVALLPGSDPKLKDEYVLYSAHADHIGIGDPWNGDSIYNGSGDNASGTAAVLEIARAFSRMPVPPRRSILFLIVTGEEEGLLGSDYYANNPTVPLSRIVANVNLDGLAFLYDFRDIVALGADHSNIAAIVDDVARHMRLEVSPDPTPEEVSFIRSDQYSFVKKGVPAVFINDGYKTVDPKLDGKKMWDDWEATRYHKPNDDMNQPLNFAGAVKATRVNLAVGYELAQQPGRPRWNAGDFFEKLATQRAAGSN
jgi:hypothetical protein